MGQEWADEFITLYADDSLLQWIINSPADLDHMCRCIRATFDLLTATGMQVNAAKSQLIIQLQGATGKRWLRAHLHRAKEGFTVSVGTPSHPILLPRVTHFTYLGVVASLGGFEMQTCKHRLRAGAQVRHRLLRVLHSAGLRVRQRAVLYQACVRSSFLYGQHAVGVTPGVLSKLEAQDAKNLRGIARSPAHLWHERSQTLRERLGLRSVHHMLEKLYRSRSKRFNDPESKNWFLDQWSWLQGVTTSSSGDTGGLHTAACSRAVACDQCGQYFTSMGQVRKHMRRAHGTEHSSARPTNPRWSQHMSDGMPHCRHCGKKFTRVEGFRKHIRKSCIVLHGRRNGEAAQTKEGKEPSEVERPQGHSCRASQDVQEAVSLIQAPAFRNMLLQNWRSVLQHPQYGPSLRTYCVVCGQWVSMLGPGVKQHTRLMHPAEWSLKGYAASRCSSLTLSVANPCAYCGTKVKDIRMHHKRCSAIFQASLAEAIVRQDQRGRGDGDGSVQGGSGSASRGAGHVNTLLFWRVRNGQEVRERDGGGGQGPAAGVEVPEGTEQGCSRRQGLEGSPDLLHGAGLVGEQGSRQPGGPLGGRGQPEWRETARSGDATPTPGGCQNGDAARGGIGPYPHRYQLHDVYGRDAGGGIRPDEADRRTVAREVHGQESYGEPPGNADAALLGEIQDRMVKTVESEEQLQRCLNIGWMAEGTTKLNPVYRYYRWNPETRTQEHCETPPLSHTAALTHVQTLQELVVQPNVLTRFRSTRPLSKDPKGEVVPFLLSLSLRQSQAGKCHEALTALSGNACLKLAGLRLRPDRGQKQPLMKELEQAYLAVPYTDWTAREQTWNRAAPHPEKATEEAK